MTRINELLPNPRVCQVERVRVPVDPAEAWVAARAVDTFKLPIFRWLVALRVLPEKAVARLRGLDVPLPRHSTIEDIVKDGKFLVLAEDEGREIVIGATGTFWKARIEWKTGVDAAKFARFDEPGWGKLAWNLRVDPAEGGGSWLTCELRVTTTDDGSWKRFRRTWRLIGPISHGLRKALLHRVAEDLTEARWGKSRPLPGDELFPLARVEWNHTVNIEAPPRRVWPWLVQMGRQRGGWYSIDLLDNGGVPSADHIIPELQKIAVGDHLPVLAKGTDNGFVVARVDPGHALVLRTDATTAEGTSYGASWAFVLSPIGDSATELLVRVRAEFPPGLKMELARTAIAGAHEIMERAQLRNLKRRIESMPA